MSREVIYAGFGRADSVNPELDRASVGTINGTQALPSSGRACVDPAIAHARCFLRLANLPSYPLDRLSRYEAVAAGRSDPICIRRIRSTQTTGSKAALSRPGKKRSLTLSAMIAVSDWPVCAVSKTTTPHRMGAALTYAAKQPCLVCGLSPSDGVSLRMPTICALRKAALGRKHHRKAKCRYRRLRRRPKVVITIQQ
jgi:hypothetical protein